jgi:hypothetical protein
MFTQAFSKIKNSAFVSIKEIYVYTTFFHIYERFPLFLVMGKQIKDRRYLATFSYLTINSSFPSTSEDCQISYSQQQLNEAASHMNL